MPSCSRTSKTEIKLFGTLIEGVLAGETGTVERRHAKLPGADNRIGGGQFHFRQTDLKSMLNVGQIGEKDEIGSQCISVSERSQAPGTSREHR